MYSKHLIERPKIQRNFFNFLYVFVFSCVFFLSFISCSEDEVVYDIGEYKVDLATVGQNDDNQFFLLDNNISLLNSNNNNALESGQRILLNYSFLPEKSIEYDHVIKVNAISAITQGKLSEVSQTSIDTIPNDPIYLESVWIGSHYLNICFYINYHSHKHSIFLITDKEKTTNESISIYFRHDANNDPPGYMRKIIASFDLSNVLGKPDGRRELIVNINSDNYEGEDYQFKF